MQISEPLVIDLVLQAPLGYVVKKKHLKNKLVKTLLFSSKAPLLKTFVFNKDQNGKYTTYTLIAHLYFSTAQEFLFSFFDIDFLPLKKNLKKMEKRKNKIEKDKKEAAKRLRELPRSR